MAATTIANVNETTFQLGTQKLLKGDYSVVYKNDMIGVNQKYTRDIVQPFLLWSDYRDSNGAAYGSFDLAATAIAGIVAKGTAGDLLISDRANVTQLTNKTTAVTSNTLSTKITTVALTDAADAAFTFTFNNNKITANSLVLANVDMNGGTGKAIVNVTPAAGSASIVVTNVGTAVFNSAIKISLVVV